MGLLLLGMILAGAEADWVMPFDVGFSADEDCRWIPSEANGLRMDANFVAGPKAGEDRGQWLAALRAYRQVLREGTRQPVAAIDFQGVRAWIRMDPKVARCYVFRPGEKARVVVDARWERGNNQLCFAFDFHRKNDDVKAGWSGVIGTARVPEDGAWHTIETEITVPDFNAELEWARPIFGMDATHDTAKGRVDVRAARFGVDNAARMAAVGEAAKVLPRKRLDRAVYNRADLQWAQKVFTCHFTFLYDSSIYDVKTNKYTLGSFLADGGYEFGGYDAMVLWHAYPRIGIDERNQFDFYRDMPGGLDGLRDLVRSVHEKGVKVFIDYNPWDTGTRREGKPDEEVLAEIVGAIEADGVFLDTMTAAPDKLRAAIDAVRPGVVFEPEGSPAIDQLGVCSASWAQWGPDPNPPGLLNLKWLEPRHTQHQIRRWDARHDTEIETAFFNGSGMLVWENIFGTYNPWQPEDRSTWRRASAVLRAFAPVFVRDDWEPFYPSLREGLYIHRWPGDGFDIYTMVNHGKLIRDEALFEVPGSDTLPLYDIWRGERLRTETVDGKTRVLGSMCPPSVPPWAGGRLGCVLRVTEVGALPEIERLLAQQREIEEQTESRNAKLPVLLPRAVESTKPVKDLPAGMVQVEGATFAMKLEHMRRECGCYPDPGAPEKDWNRFLAGTPFDGQITHNFSATVATFGIDEAKVTNAEFRKFLDATGYRPAHSENFLKHWPNGVMPPELADHPVVYVDLDDARAYAKWAGKRLPTEEEWHLAAQGVDGRKWPWGNEFKAENCNTTNGTTPVRKYTQGRSPCGCYDMCGNAWEWTESARCDGHTRFCILQGGSYFKAQGSIWYTDGGPQPCTNHAKFLLMWPGLDRCATIGFRCVVDL